MGYLLIESIPSQTTLFRGAITVARATVIRRIRDHSFIQKSISIWQDQLKDKERQDHLPKKINI